MTALLTVRIGDVGMCVGDKNDPDVALFEERFAWVWEGQGGPCAILALSEMAKRGSP